MRIRQIIGPWVLAGLAALVLPAACRAQAVVTVDRRVTVGVSRLRLGITHTQVAWEAGDPAAVARARGLLRGRLPIQNQSIMGWGVGDPEPSPGRYDFAGLDRRVALMRSLGGEMVLTLCSAPGWMKATGQEWDMNDRVAEAHVADFAALCRVIALRYPDVRYFDVWNEWKGYWGDPPAYTRLYNAVYTAVKAVRPDAQVGGFYLPVAGDGSGARGYTGEGTQTPVTAGDMQALDYWLANKAGADFLAIDRWLVDWKNKNAVKPSDQLALTPMYGKVLETITARTTLPVWYAEYYTWRHNPGGTAFIACAEASLYSWMIKGTQGRSVTALLWNPSAGEEDVNDYLFTETKTPVGGTPTPHYAVFKGMHDRFPPGTALCRAASSDPFVEVLASPATTLLINKHDTAQRVTVNGKSYALAAYAVQFIRTPGPPLARRRTRNKSHKFMEEPMSLEDSGLDADPIETKTPPDASRRRLLRLAPLVPLGALLGWALTRRPDPDAGKLRVTAIDVGQGDSTLIQTPGGRTVLIDGGGSGDEADGGAFDVGEKVVVPFLHFLGINRLDVLILTHPHGDHVGGLAAVLRAQQIGTILDGTTLPYPSPAYAQFLALVRRKRVPYTRAERGQTLDLGDGVTLRVLNPPPTPVFGTGAVYGTASDDATVNNYSVGLRLTYGRTRFVFTGDAETEAEGAMLDAHADLACDVLKAGHHGSKNATGDDWLARLQPAQAVISCGRHNRFGHPAPSTLARLASHGVQVYRTDHQGAITFVSDGRTVTARPYLG